MLRTQVSPSSVQLCAAQVCAAQVCAAQVCAEQMCTTQVLPVSGSYHLVAIYTLTLKGRCRGHHCCNCHMPGTVWALHMQQPLPQGLSSPSVLGATVEAQGV